MAELGKIERLNIEEFKGKRKLFCIPNIFIPDNEDEKLKSLVEQYWQEANSHIERLEKLGFVTKIFLETIFIEGQDAVNIIRETNPYLYFLIEKKVSQGATVIGIEDPEIFGAFIDWSNCLRIVKTASVLQKVFNYYNEINQKRIEIISNKINENLQEGECAIVILRDQERMKLSLPKDIDIFLVVPSVYDDILKYLRDKFLS
jgi:ferritin-like metal-binding protein YciE